MALYHVVFLLLSFLGILGNIEAENELNSRCSVLVKGMVECKDVGQGGVSCKMFCQNSETFRYECSKDRGWDRRLPPCVTEGKDLPSCRITVRNGKVLCSGDVRDEIGCVMYCDAKYMGYYSCSKDRGWYKTLPPCISGVKANARCSLALRNSAAICEEVGGGEIACTVICQDRPQGFYRCSRDQGWNKVLPACVSGLRDSMCNLVVRNGTASCHVEDAGDIACKVLCAGKYQGLYRCKEGHGWERRLPPCVSYLS